MIVGVNERHQVRFYDLRTERWRQSFPGQLRNHPQLMIRSRQANPKKVISSFALLEWTKTPQVNTDHPRIGSWACCFTVNLPANSGYDSLRISLQAIHWTQEAWLHFSLSGSRSAFSEITSLVKQKAATDQELRQLRWRVAKSCTSWKRW